MGKNNRSPCVSLYRCGAHRLILCIWGEVLTGRKPGAVIQMQLVLARSLGFTRWILGMGGAVLKGQRNRGQKEVYGLGPQRLTNHRDTIQRLLQTSNEAVIMNQGRWGEGGWEKKHHADVEARPLEHLHSWKQANRTMMFLSYPTLIAELHNKTSILFMLFTGGPIPSLKQYLASVQVKLSWQHLWNSINCYKNELWLVRHLQWK